MPNAYTLEYFPPRNRGNTNLIRQRHAIYHFFNTNNPSVPVWSMSPDFFYKNETLKNGSRKTIEEKRRRLLNLVGGSPRRLHTILTGTINSRFPNLHRTFRTPGARAAHIGQLEFYRRLYSTAFPEFPGLPHHNIRLSRVDRLPPNRIPNAQLHHILKTYYNQVTLENPNISRTNRYRNLKTRFPVNQRLDNIKRQYRKRTVAATRIQSFARGMIARRRTTATRTARTRTSASRR